MHYYNPRTAVNEIREQLASNERRLAFFFGAGTSMSVGLPGIENLTSLVNDKLCSPYNKYYKTVRSEIKDKTNITVEDIINRIRIYRELAGKSEQSQFAGIRGATKLINFDKNICSTISSIINHTEIKSLKPHLSFSQWLRTIYVRRDRPIEIFTLNYDLLIERALELMSLPFFDGFMGSEYPFFVPESVEADFTQKDQGACPPRGWTRLYKLHGSINWVIKNINSVDRIVRISGNNVERSSADELVIFPSRDKYIQSRKLPFITFQDHFRRLISQGEILLIILGYSFSDEHINDIIIQALRANPHLSVSVFSYTTPQSIVIDFAASNRGLTIYSPDNITLGCRQYNWETLIPKESIVGNTKIWDNETNKFLLCDFINFCSFLEEFIVLYEPSAAQTAPPQANENQKDSNNSHEK